MKILRQSYLPVSLIVCILFVGVVFAVQTPAHAFHHAHHKASTHAGLLCSWMCAAGQVDQTSQIIVETPSYESDRIELLPTVLPHPVLLRSLLPRGPPIR